MHYAFDEFEFDADRLELRCAGLPLKADALVLRLLRALVQRPGELVSKRELIAEVWEGRAVSENVITVAMVRLRKTLGQHASEREFVKNVHGRGYRFVQPVTQREAPLNSLVTHAETHLAPPFVGRGVALERLQHALREASAGRGSMCCVVGEAGIGKTRLLEELEREIEVAPFQLAWAHCQAGHAPPLWPFVQLLRALQEQLLAGGQHMDAALKSGFEQLLASLGEPRSGSAQTLEQSTPPGFDASAKHRTFDAVTRLLGQVSQLTPCLLIIDDLHWADAASLELLRFWIDRLPRTRIAFVATLRDVESQRLDNRHLNELLGHRNSQRIELLRLGEGDVQTYVRALLPYAEPNLWRAVSHKSEGNPFFMVELTRVLHEAARPEQEDRLRVPDAALTLLRQRVRALDDATRGVLSRAAVIGRNFDLGLLARVCGEEPGAIMDCLDAAIAGAVVVPLRDSKTRFQFRHELLKDVLYEGLTPAQRRACHLRVAQALEQRADAGAALPASLLAHHFYSALPDSDPRQAVRYAVQSAEASIYGYAYIDAVRALGRAREALSLVPNPSIRLRLALLLRQTLCARVCRTEEFERLVQELLQLAHEHKAGEVLAQATLLLGPHPGFAVVAGSGAALRDALAALLPEQEALRAALLSRLSTLGPLAFDAAKSEAQLERAFEVAEQSGVLAAQHTTCAARLYLLGGPDQRPRAEQSAHRLEQLCRENPQQLTVPPVLILLHHAIRALQDGELERAAQMVERAEERSRVIDSQELFWHAQRFRLLLRVNQGDSRDLSPSLTSLHQRGAREAILGAQLLAVHDRVLLSGKRVTLDAAERTALTLDMDDPPVRWATKLRVLSQAGLRDEALSTLRRVAPSELANLPHDRDYLGTLGGVARALEALGLADEYAEATLALLTPYPLHFAAHASFLCEGAVPQLLGSLAQLLGRQREAVRYFEQGVQRAEQVGFVRCAAEARLALTLCREGARAGGQRG